MSVKVTTTRAPVTTLINITKNKIKKENYVTKLDQPKPPKCITLKISSTKPCPYISKFTPKPPKCIAL